jgi:hypothetical protein
LLTGAELKGKTASIQSIAECIQQSNVLSLFSSSISFSSCYGFAGLRLRSLFGALDLHLSGGIAPPVEHLQKRAEGR